MGTEGRALAGLRATWPLVYAYLPRRPALQPAHSPLRLRWPDQWRMLPRHVEQQLVPVLKRGDIVIMDNLGSHKSAELRRMIRAARARLWYLPPCSPDLNPIEQAFAKIKHWMRLAQKRTVEDLWRHIGTLVTAIQPTECNNYFQNAGYASIK